MQRVLILGSGGAGKSSLAVQLGARTGLPVIHLDVLYWKPGWIESPREVWADTVARITQGEQWIIDGNYSGTIETRIAAADTVIFLDRSRLICLWRILGRRWRYRQRPRPDISPGCPERLNGEFIRWIWNFPADQKPGLLRHLAMARTNQNVITLRSDREVESFLQSAAKPAPAKLGSSGKCVSPVH